MRLLLGRLGVPFDLVELNILQGATRTPEYLARNPDGKIPLLELEGGIDLADFPAIGAWLERVRGQPGHIPIAAA